MRNFSQQLIDSLDKTTQHGFAAALMICIANLKNEKNLLIRVHLGESIEQEIDYCKQIARMMLGGEDETV